MAIPFQMPTDNAGAVVPGQWNPFEGLTFQLVPMGGSTSPGSVAPTGGPNPKPQSPQMARSPEPLRPPHQDYLQNPIGFLNNIRFGGSGPFNPYAGGLRGGMLGGIPQDLASLFPNMAQ